MFDVASELAARPGLLRWLELEQTVHDRLFHPRGFASIAEGESGVRPELRAKSRACWLLDVCWIPEGEARRYFCSLPSGFERVTRFATEPGGENATQRAA